MVRILHDDWSIMMGENTFLLNKELLYEEPTCKRLNSLSKWLQINMFGGGGGESNR